MAIRILSELVTLSRQLGKPQRGCSIVGEGNTSAKIDERSMWIKASGATLGASAADSFVRVDRARVLTLLESGVTTFRETHLGLEDAKVDHEVPHRPSREALLHAVCLELDDVTFVARTHPTAVDGLVCSREFTDLAGLRLTPDHVAVCGRAPLLVPYVRPGVGLAVELRRRLAEFVRDNSTYPRIVLLQNNGMLALGSSGTDVLAATLMQIEIARVLGVSRGFGGPRPLTDEELDELTTAADPFDGPTTREIS